MWHSIGPLTFFVYLFRGLRGHQDLKEWSDKGTIDELEDVNEETSSEDRLHLGSHVNRIFDPCSALV